MSAQPTPDAYNVTRAHLHEIVDSCRELPPSNTAIPEWVSSELARELAILWAGVADYSSNPEATERAIRWSSYWSDCARQLLHLTGKTPEPSTDTLAYKVASLRERLELYSTPAPEAPALSAPTGIPATAMPILTTPATVLPVEPALDLEPASELPEAPTNGAATLAEPRAPLPVFTEAESVVREDAITLPANIKARSIIVLSVAFVLVGLLLALAASTGTTILSDAQATSGESRQATETLQAHSLLPRAHETILIHKRIGVISLDDPQYVAVVQGIERALKRHTKLIENITLPIGVAGEQSLSKNRTSSIAQFDMRGDPSTAYKRVGATVKEFEKFSVLYPDFEISEFGTATAKRASLRTTEQVSSLSEIMTVPITMIVLLLALGTAVAAGLPVIQAIISVASATAAVALVGQIQPASTLVEPVIILVGMAVGTDYAFFFLARAREERSIGHEPSMAIARAGATSGRAVAVSGLTVMVSMAGMYLSGDANFKSVATGAILVVGFSVIASLTVLPALLHLLGDRIERLRLSSLFGHTSGPYTRIGWLARYVDRHPTRAAVLSLLLLLVLAAPLVHMTTKQPAFDEVNAAGINEVKTFHSLQKLFPGAATTTYVVVDATNVKDVKITTALDQFQKTIVKKGVARELISRHVSPDGRVARIDLQLIAGKESDTTLNQLRNKIIPSTIGKVADNVAVTGLTADDHDFNSLMNQRMTIVFSFVMLMTFVVLLVTFRSIVIPVKAIILNLLSVGAAYGALIFVFQWGYGAALLGATSTGAVVAWLPMFLFVILFGLSMDYHIFILSRIRELWVSGLSTDRAVREGIASTSKTVMSAAAVMFAVFAVFIFMPPLDMKQLGFGLSVAVMIDAFLVRTVLLPASMRMVGDWNWYLPKFLNWLPDLGERSIGLPRLLMDPVLPQTDVSARTEADGQIAAFFDVDRTLLAGDSSLRLASVLRHRGLVTRRQQLRAGYVYLRQQFGGVHDPTDTFVRVTRDIVSGWNQGDVSRIVHEEFEQQLRPVLYDDALRLIARHRAAGHKVYLVSASMSEIVVPLADLLGLDGAICSQLEVVEGCYSGDMSTICFGEGKRVELMRFADQHNIDLTSSFGYGDSAADLPFLQSVGHPCAVNADRGLRRIARRSEWQTVNFSGCVGHQKIAA